MTKRLIEIDFFRGLAVLLMIVYHFLFVSDLLGLLTVDLDLPSVNALARLVQFTFLGLVGVSVFMSRRGFDGQLKRGMMIFGAGLLVSLVTWITYPSDWVVFGILHLIGVSVPLLVLFKKIPWWVLMPLALCWWIFGLWLGMHFIEGVWGVPFGLRYPLFQSFDYFPIFPWFGVCLFGLGLGQFLYGPVGKNLKWREWSVSQFVFKGMQHVQPLIWMGKHALLIYLIHVPVLYGVVFFLSSLV